MILLTSTDELKIVLSGSVTTSQPQWTVSWADVGDTGSTFEPNSATGVTNNTTAVTMAGSPGTGKKRQIKYIAVWNADSVSRQLSVYVYDGANTRTQIKPTLAAGDGLYYGEGGWRIVNAQGQVSTIIAVPDGDKGDVVVSSSGTVWTIDADSVSRSKLTALAKTEAMEVACSDETTALTATAGKITFRMPYAFTLTDIRASLTTAQTSGSIFTVDVNEGGTSILSTKLTIDNGEKTSTTAATARVISDTSLADDAEMSVDIDQIGDGTAKGLKVTLIGYPT